MSRRTFLSIALGSLLVGVGLSCSESDSLQSDPETASIEVKPATEASPSDNKPSVEINDPEKATATTELDDADASASVKETNESEIVKVDAEEVLKDALARAVPYRDALFLTSRFVLVESDSALRDFRASRFHPPSTTNGTASSRDARSADLHQQ